MRIYGRKVLSQRNKSIQKTEDMRDIPMAESRMGLRLSVAVVSASASSASESRPVLLLVVIIAGMGCQALSTENLCLQNTHQHFLVSFSLCSVDFEAINLFCWVQATGKKAQFNINLGPGAAIGSYSVNCPSSLRSWYLPI